MQQILTPGHIGVVSIIVSILFFLQRFVVRKMKYYYKKTYLLTLKIGAFTRNRAFIFKEHILETFYRGKIKNVLFSANEEWAEIIGKSFKHTGFKVDFKPFNPLEFKSYDLIVPLCIPDLKVCMANRELLEQQSVAIPSDESMEICNDKHTFNDFMIANGFAAYIPNVEKPFQYPYILKKNIDEYGKYTFIIKNPEDERIHFDDLRDEAFYCQELVPGKYEYAAHIIFRGGKIVSDLNIRYTFEHEHYIKGKEVYVCKEVFPSSHLELFTDILNKIGFEGICCFNYKEVNGRPMIFEINPRFGGSLTDYFFSMMRKLNSGKNPKVPVVG
jgi:hypothetical protein